MPLHVVVIWFAVVVVLRLVGVPTEVGVGVGGVAAMGYLGVSFKRAMQARHREFVLYQRSGLAEIDEMTGQQFERRLAALYRDLGYTVAETPASGDFGADLILQRNGTTIAVQAKCQRRPVGVKAVQEALGAREYYRTHAAAVVTNSTFTAAAFDFAERTGIRLVDRASLHRKLLEVDAARVSLGSEQRSVVERLRVSLRLRN